MTKFMIDNNEFTLTGENEYEGKLCVWGEEVTIFVDSQENQEKIVSFVQDKIQWIDENKDKIIDAFMEENSHYIEVINDMVNLMLSVKLMRRALLARCLLIMYLYF